LDEKRVKTASEKTNAPPQGRRAYRILKPGSVATMDFSPDRLNVEINDQGVVTRLFCG
jgi:hypothetical protein